MLTTSVQWPKQPSIRSGNTQILIIFLFHSSWLINHVICFSEDYDLADKGAREEDDTTEDMELDSGVEMDQGSRDQHNREANGTMDGGFESPVKNPRERKLVAERVKQKHNRKRKE